MTKTLKAGSEALLVYAAGDADRVRILSLTDEAVVVRVVGGERIIRAMPEDIGIGVDDSLVAEVDSGLCQHVQHRTDRQSLQCQRTVHGAEVNHLHTVALGWIRVDGGHIVGPEHRPL